MARSTAVTANRAEWPGTYAFQLLISPLRDWRVLNATCTACWIAWYTTGVSSPSIAPIPAADAGHRCAM